MSAPMDLLVTARTVSVERYPGLGESPEDAAQQLAAYLKHAGLNPARTGTTVVYRNPAGEQVTIEYRAAS